MSDDVKKFFLALFSLILAVGVVLGIVFISRQIIDDKNETDKTYAETIEGLEKEININIENVIRLQGDIDILTKENTKLTTTVNDYEVQITILNNTIKENEATIVEKNNVISEKQTQIITLTNTITECNEKIVVLEKDNETNLAEIEKLKAQIQSLESEKAELLTQIDELNSQIEELNNQITVLNGIIAEKDATIADLNAQIAAKDEEKDKLVININVLNQTIIELNAKVKALEDAQSSDPNKIYLKDILTASVYSYDLDENYFIVNLVSNENSNFVKSYLLNKYDYSCSYLADLESCCDKFYLMKDGDIFIYTSRSTTGSSYVFDKNSNSIISAGNGNKILFELDNGDLLVVDNGGWCFQRVNANDNTFVNIEDSRSDVNSVAGVDMGIITLKDSETLLLYCRRDDEFGGFFELDLTTNMLTRIHESVGMGFCYYDSYISEKNAALLFSFTSNGFVFVSLDDYSITSIDNSCGYIGDYTVSKLNSKFYKITFSNGRVFYIDIDNNKMLTELPISVNIKYRKAIDGAVGTWQSDTAYEEVSSNAVDLIAYFDILEEGSNYKTYKITDNYDTENEMVIYVDRHLLTNSSYVLSVLKNGSQVKLNTTAVNDSSLGTGIYKYKFTFGDDYNDYVITDSDGIKHIDIYVNVG